MTVLDIISDTDNIHILFISLTVSTNFCHVVVFKMFSPNVNGIFYIVVIYLDFLFVFEEDL